MNYFSSDSDSTRQYICLSSSASCDVFKDNTASHFTNLLPNPIYNRDNRTYYLRVHSISLSNRLRHTFWDWEKSYLRIHIREVSEQGTAKGYMHAAAGFTFPIQNPIGGASPVGTHTFETAPYLPLRFQYLSKLELYLTDQDNLPVELAVGSPTLIWIKMSDRPRETQFTITCNSGRHDLYPSNDLNNFISPLPSEMDLGGYEVALSQIVYPPGLQETEEMAILTIGDDYLMRYQLTGRVADGSIMVYSIQSDIDRSKYRRVFRLGVEMDPVDGSFLGETYFARHRTHGADLNGGGPIRVTFNDVFARICGRPQAHGFSVELMPGQAVSFAGSGPNPFNAIPNPVALLHCDLVETNIVAGGQGNLLHCVPVYMNKDGDEDRLYEPKRLAYHSVKSTPFNSIRFSFCRESGAYRKLYTEHGHAEELMISLVFRQKRK